MAGSLSAGKCSYSLCKRFAVSLYNLANWASYIGRTRANSPSNASLIVWACGDSTAAAALGGALGTEDAVLLAEDGGRLTDEARGGGGATAAGTGAGAGAGAGAGDATELRGGGVALARGGGATAVRDGGRAAAGACGGATGEGVLPGGGA